VVGRGRLPGRGDQLMSVVEFSAGKGALVYVEALDGQAVDGQAVEDGSTGLSRAGAGDRVVRAATRTWEQSLEGMQAAAEGALNQLRQIEPVPDEVKVSFQVAINGKLGATLVSAGADAHLKVEVVWKAEKATAEPSD
jgi:hypothetical protein